MPIEQAEKQSSSPTLKWWQAFILIIVCALGYNLAFATRWGGIAILPALASLFLLSHTRTAWWAWRLGLLSGFAIAITQLWFFFAVFSWAALGTWLLFALPFSLFVLLHYHLRRIVSPQWLIILTPVLWLGIEYFRSEFTYIKFAWLTPGQVFAYLPSLAYFGGLGIFAWSFIFTLLAALWLYPKTSLRLLGILLSLVVWGLLYYPFSPIASERSLSIPIAGVQLEGASPHEVATALDRLATAHPEAQILVTPEYTFASPVPEVVRAVIRRHHRYLISGGMLMLEGSQFYNMAFVIDPDGHDVFQQSKSVPVQFMNDGLPAPDRKTWNSPWGKVGIATCYDVSYTRVMDDFVAEGAQAFIIPTMDALSWGFYERHWLHGRLAPIRSAEYGLPILGVWTSGESQLTDRHGRVIAHASFPGQGEFITGSLQLAPPNSPHIPWDRYLALICSLLTGLFTLFLLGKSLVFNKKIATKVG